MNVFPISYYYFSYELGVVEAGIIMTAEGGNARPLCY